MSKHISVSDIANFLVTEYYGNNYIINKLASINKANNNALVFTKNKTINDDIKSESLILCPLDFICNQNHTYTFIKVKNPRLAFAKVVNHFFIPKPSTNIHPTVIIGDNCNIQDNVSIGVNCYIGNNVEIDDNTIINHNVVIYDNTKIGKNCYIKSGTIIGEDGFGFDFEDDYTPVKIPHLGNVIICDNVEIGAKNTIARGTLDNTVINNNVKIDDQVHIAHNCNIGQNTIITACAEISGSVTIGENCWIGPNSSIIQKLKIGNNATIGIGAVVTKNVLDNQKIMGLEGLYLRNLVAVKRRIKYGK